MKASQLLRRVLIVGSIGCVPILLGASQNKAPCPQPSTITDTKYAPGQVWSYHNRKTEADATLTVLKVESLPKVGVVVHVRLDGIRLRNCSGGHEPTQIEHAPFTREALDRSVVKLIRTGEVPAFQDGYQNWREHCGGVYTITVAEMIAVDEQTFNNGLTCD